MNVLEKIKCLPIHLKGYLMCDPERNGEYRALKKLIKYRLPKEPVIFDVGANFGNYALKVYDYNPKSNIHCFEPFEYTYKKLINSTKHLGETLFCNQLALSNTIEINKVVYEFSEGYETNSLEFHPEYMSKNSKQVSISTTTIDQYCQQHNINNIDFLKIDVEGHEMNVLLGAKTMLESKKIKAIQFEYNYLWKNTSNTLEKAHNVLNELYNVYRITPLIDLKINAFTNALENYPQASNYLAVLKNEKSFK